MENDFATEDETRPDGIARLPMVEMTAMESVQRQLDTAVWLSVHDVQFVALADDVEVR
jgi:hypothetical protein